MDAGCKKLVLFSPAKLNLFFRVLRLREDRFHEIASLFQAISLGDAIEIELADEDRLICNDPAIPVDSTNLVSKATELFRQKSGIRFFTSIKLDKRIPIQSGLGGGSSNAATVLWGLNRLFGNKFSNQELQSWAGEIGSDVSFFFSSGVAYCTGRGEKVENLDLALTKTFWLAKPKYGLSTPLVYKNCQPDNFQARDPMSTLQKYYQGYPEYFNDLEIPAFKLLPELESLKKNLLNLGFTEVMMTGSGTAFFCFSHEHLENPTLADIDFFPVSFILRRAENWYALSS